MNSFLICFSAGECFLLSILLFLHPLWQNPRANQWLGLFVFIVATAFVGIYLERVSHPGSYHRLLNTLNCLQFLLAPSLFLSIRYFVDPARVLKPSDGFHFLPFLVCTVWELLRPEKTFSLVNLPLFDMGDTVFLLRDLLPFQLLVYLALGYGALARHRRNLRLIAAETSGIDLDWLRGVLGVLALAVIFWINDALFEISFLLQLMPFVYPAVICFLAYYAIRQRTVFAFRQNELREIADILNETSGRSAIARQARLSAQEIAALSVQLDRLMQQDKLFLDSTLSLPGLAEKLAISIHDASYLVNEVSGGNFYQLVNGYRIAEAKRLLTPDSMTELNILGIAFAAGFNSKTTFNTTFKKMVGVSPGAYAKTAHKQ